MNKNGFTEILRYNEFAESRAEKERGCFGSNKVSKKILFMTYSFILDFLQLLAVKTANYLPVNISTQETCPSVL